MPPIPTVKVFLAKVKEEMTLGTHKLDAKAGELVLVHRCPQHPDIRFWVYSFTDDARDWGTATWITSEEAFQHLESLRVDGQAIGKEVSIHRDATIYTYPDAARDVISELKKQVVRGSTPELPFPTTT